MNEPRIDIDAHHMTRLRVILFAIAIFSVSVVVVVLLISPSTNGAATPKPQRIVTMVADAR